MYPDKGKFEDEIVQPIRSPQNPRFYLLQIHYTVIYTYVCTYTLKILERELGYKHFQIESTLTCKRTNEKIPQQQILLSLISKQE